jgi:tetratricopeptide (TPR) repeat protein
MNITTSSAARDFLRLGDLERARAAVDACFSKHKDEGSSPDIWAFRLIHVDLTRLHGHTDLALDYLTSMESLWPPGMEDICSLVGIKKSKGYCLGHLGKYAPSHELMGEAESLATASGSLELVSEVHQCQAMIFYLQRDYESSDRIFRLILKASDQIGGWYFRANGLWGIGKNLMIQGHHQAAMPWLEESLALFDAAGARASVAVVWGEMAVCHLGMGDDAKSLELLENALKIQEEAGRVQNYLVVLANIGNVYLHRRDYLTAIDYYRRALELAHEIKDPVSIQKWSRNIWLAYARLRESVDRLEPRIA